MFRRRPRKKSKKRGTVFRMSVVLFVATLCFSTAVVQAVRLQVYQAEELSNRARKEYARALTLLPQRGDIADRRGRRLASSVEVYSLYAESIRIDDPKPVAQKLSKLLDLDYLKTYEKLSSKRWFVWIKRKLTPTQKAEVAELNIPALRFVPETKRIYPNRELASHVLGFVGVDGKGLEGLELKFEGDLRGAKGSIPIYRDRLGRTVYREESPERFQPAGGNLVLTLDKTLQYRMENALRKAVTEQRAKSGMAVMMDPWTGEIMALSVFPSYDPNLFWKYPAANRRNRVVVDCFEPGSTMKVFTAMMAVENGSVRPGEAIYCENGRYKVGGHVVRDTHPHEWLTLDRIIQVSSNIGALKVGMRLKKPVLYEGLRAFGFGEPTGIDLPGETKGLLRPVGNWVTIDFATICFGQGVSISPLQLVTAMSAVANGGMIMRPHVVKHLEDPNGKIIRTFAPQPVRRVVSEKTAKIVGEMLKKVTEHGGTGSRAAVEGYKVAGKTGTAQKVDPSTGRYSGRNFVSSFVGYFPADAPVAALLVMIDEPRKATYGGLVAAPVFKDIAEQTIPYLGIKPDEVYMAEGEIDSAATSAATASNASPVLNPAEEAEDPGIMPNLLGLDARSALVMLTGRGMEVGLLGSGVVVKQDPAPGMSLDGVRHCRIYLGEEQAI
jgi:cell division protein FtsI (penicillin-binding protein 3)